MTKIIAVILFLFAASAHAQHLFSDGIKQLRLDTLEFKKIKKDKPKQFKLDSLQLSLVESNTEVIFSDGMKRELPEVVSYRGKIAGDSRSVVAISFTDEVMGFISNGNGNHIIGKGKDNHVVYNDKDFPMQFECSFQGDIGVTGTENIIPPQTTKCVNWYWEIDYDLFLNKGSAANVNSYIQGVFNQVATLFANDGITIKLKTLFIWVTPDPYTSTTTGGNLNQFGAYRTTFNGDLAHLIGLKGNGGIAYMNGLCSSNSLNKKAYSGIFTTYNNVPVYSWTVENIAHEEGHLLGLNHTHDCAWNGNFTKIDSCGDKAGYAGTGFYGCPLIPNATVPYNGGTIESYCHLTTSGINFSKGFGEQPRNRMISKINAATCLTSCTVTPPTSIKIDSIQTSTISKAWFKCYWQMVSGATDYRFYFQRTTNTGKSSVVVTTSPRVFSLSANISYNIWFEARNSSGVVIGASPKITIVTGTGIVYK